VGIGGVGAVAQNFKAVDDVLVKVKEAGTQGNGERVAVTEIRMGKKSFPETRRTPSKKKNLDVRLCSKRKRKMEDSLPTLQKYGKKKARK